MSADLQGVSRKQDTSLLHQVGFPIGWSFGYGITVRCANLGEREPTQSLSDICSEWTELRSYWARWAFSGRSRQLISQEIAQSFPFAEAAAD